MNDRPTKTSPVQTILSSKLLRLLVVAVALVVGVWLGTNGLSSQVQDNQATFLADAVRRSAVQCYALEGSFPEDVAYLEQNYGLYIDRGHYAVYYEPMGGNLIPQIRVITVHK
ncbi:MAG: hypothetical protein LBS58_02380 [Coriobacteriales bacterium]|jgi:hypothetical protein|nr:hypothetical protein [Coriobacteriales bacterium]